jgi:hypothetical protein
MAEKKPTLRDILGDLPVAEQPISAIDEETRLRQEGVKSDQRLKGKYGNWLLYGLAAQIVVVDAVFILYASYGVHWDIGPAVMDMWLAATLVEVIGVVHVVTKHLFPSREGASA